MALDLDIHEYFAIALWSLICLLIIFYLFRKQLPLLKYALVYLAHVRIPVIHYVLPEIGGVILYHSANAIVFRLEGRSSSQFFAIVNLGLLYLGGRTSLIANSIGISFRTYYLAHYAVATAVVALSVIHTTQAMELGSFDKLQAASGWLVFGLLGFCLILPILHLMFHSAGHAGHYISFRIHHILFSSFVLISLGWHLWTVSTRFSFAWVMLFSTGLLWMFSIALRLLKWYGYRSARMTIQGPENAKITRLSVDTGSTVPALPGSYFYVNIPGQRGVCVPVAWWTDDVNGSIRHFDILVNREMKSAPLRPGLSGPYGGDLSMGAFETLILAGEGIGIAGILPFALSLLSRKKRDKQNKGDVPLHCDITRCIDLVWKLDDNRQYDYAAEYFDSLAATSRDITPQTRDDPDKQRVSILRVFVIYPERADESTEEPKEPKEPKLPALKNWNAVNSQGLNILSQRIQKVANGKPGRTLVVASGTRCFMNTARTMTLQHSSSKNIIWFRELSYRPDTLRKPSYPML